MAGSLYIVIVGCGRLGSYVANQLSQGGHSVVVIDLSPESFRHLSVGYSGFRVEGDGTELAILKQAKTTKADLVLATTHCDNANLMIAQLARRVLGVPRVFARVFDPQREESYRLLGVETVCPTVLGGDALLDMLGRPDETGEWAPE